MIDSGSWGKIHLSHWVFDNVKILKMLIIHWTKETITVNLSCAKYPRIILILSLFVQTL